MTASRTHAPRRSGRPGTSSILLILGLALTAGLAGPLTASRAADSTPRTGFVGPDLHSLVVAPTDPSQLFVGGHQAVATSTNNGQNWHAVRSLKNADAMGWGFAGTTVWVSGHPGLNRSDDGGQTFQQLNSGLPNTDVHAFGAGPSILYGASPAVGLFTSTDDGRSWNIVTRDVGQGFFGRIVVDPTDTNHVLAADAANGPTESRDGGRTWRRLGGIASAAWLSTSTDLMTQVASGPAGVVRSTDAGKTWSPLDAPKRALLVELQPDQPETLYAAANVRNRARIWISHDAGATWTRT